MQFALPYRMTNTSGEFFHLLMTRGPIADEQSAINATTATLRALSAYLSEDEAEALRAELPGEIAPCLMGAERPRAFELEAFYADVAERAAVEQAVAMEQAQIVLMAIASWVGAAALERLRVHLPAASELLAHRRSGAAETVNNGAPGPRIGARSVASWRPDPQRHLSTGHPPGAHSDSVVSSDNPHGETKLSSSQGLTQEREQETIATGRTGAERQLSGGGRSD